MIRALFALYGFGHWLPDAEFNAPPPPPPVAARSVASSSGPVAVPYGVQVPPLWRGGGPTEATPARAQRPVTYGGRHLQP